MRIIILFLFIGFCHILSVSAQQEITVQFKSGEKTYSDNIEEFIDNPNLGARDIVNGYFHRYIQFEAIPTFEEQEALKGMGLRLLEYIPDYTYLIAFPSGFDLSQLSSFQARSAFLPDTEDKQDLRITDQSWPAWADEGLNLKLVIRAHELSLIHI